MLRSYKEILAEKSFRNSSKAGGADKGCDKYLLISPTSDETVVEDEATDKES